ncbi:DUF2878 family protein [Venatoribacter cucullus]|uniref:DUF2878 family protein n=1 Tax=Venatoribacter cucullus TaxID=2661630 RepID=UPI0019361C29|nr:DUF2878 family protein [Venatoribacter cucullus]QQD20789.1 DUF2878 family protein [Oceanospirillaceae bacterium ASx5O]UZK02925.1 DUF2878 family protein [Venatoribacter cucullus]
MTIRHSALYTGSLRHRRFAPVQNTLQYRVYMVLLDLDETDAVMQLHPLWRSRPGWLAWAQFRRSDYFAGHSAALIPLWLMLLWLAFACTLRHSLDWLLRKPWLAVLLGLTAAPWSYYAGDLLGAVDAAPVALIMIGIGWAMLMFSMARLRPITVKAEES